MRIGLVGWGAMGQTVAKLLENSPVEIAFVAVKDPGREGSDLPSGTTVISDPAEVVRHDVQLVAEAAGRDSVEPWGHAALRMGADFVVSSVSALADSELLDSLRDSAVRHGCQLEIQTGALGGIDALAAAMRMGVDSVEHRIVKPPKAWRATAAEDLCDLDNLSEPYTFFHDSAVATATAFPKNANVAMTTALASIGPERTMISLIADPRSTTNRHEISASGAFGSMDVSIANNPLPDNPKTSAMAALNLARAIQNRVDPVII